MAASIFGLFGRWEFGKSAEDLTVRPRLRPEPPSAYAEALSAGWVPPLPEVPLVPRSAGRATCDEADSEQFLARVYLHQEC